jgi:hypothetical protein
MYVGIGVMKDYKLKLRNLRVSHRLDKLLQKKKGVPKKKSNKRHSTFDLK